MLTVTGVSVLNHASASKLAFRRRARAKVSAFSSRRAVMSALQRTNRSISAGRIGLLKHVLTGRRCITTEQQILFSVKTTDGVPKTMFKPDPADHGYKSNLDYLNAQ